MNDYLRPAAQSARAEKPTETGMHGEREPTLCMDAWALRQNTSTFYSPFRTDMK